MLKVILIIIFAEIWNTTGHILYKKGADDFAGYDFSTPGGIAAFCGGIVKNPVILLGFVSMMISLLIWVVALAQADLSFVFPMGSIHYIFVLIGAKFFLNEPFDRMKVIGAILILTGVVLIGRG